MTEPVSTGLRLRVFRREADYFLAAVRKAPNCADIFKQREAWRKILRSYTELVADFFARAATQVQLRANRIPTDLLQDRERHRHLSARGTRISQPIYDFCMEVFCAHGVTIPRMTRSCLAMSTLRERLIAGPRRIGIGWGSFNRGEHPSKTQNPPWRRAGVPGKPGEFDECRNHEFP